VRINVTGGYGDVIARVVRRPADPLANWMFIVRATGYVIEPAQGSDPRAARTIAQFAQWQTGQMDVQAAYAAANNLSIINGTSEDTVLVYGQDYCGVASAVAGVRVPNSGGGNDVPSGDGYFGYPNRWITYGAPVKNESGDKPSVAKGTNIDWEAMTGGGFTPDYTSIQAGDNTYSSQLVTGNATLSTNWGTGLLIVTGDLTFSGVWAQWYGVILVGGRVYFDASDYTLVMGTMVSGLNEGLGTPATASQIGNRDVFLYYSSCAVDYTINKLSGFAPVTNGWVDNWAQY
jgi:hypothetical protein